MVGAPPIEKAATPTTTPAGGEVESGTTVTLHTDTAGADIYYTTDGTEPKTSVDDSTSKYGTPIIVDRDMTIKAIAVKAGMENSTVMETAYTLLKKSTIAAARAEPDGARVWVEGVVNYVDGKSVYMQDSSGKGIVARFGTDSTLIVGQKVEVKGTLGQYNNLLQINVTDSTPGDTGNTLTPVDTNLGVLAAGGSQAETLEGVQVKLTGVLIEEISTHSLPNITISQTIEGEKKTIIIYKSQPLPSSAAAGCIVDVVAVVDQFHASDPNAGYQLRVARAGDYTNIQNPNKVATPTATPVGGSEVESGTTVTLNTLTPDAKIYYTTDGSIPTTGADSTTSEYGGPIAVTGELGANITIKAIAVKTGLTDSDILTAAYKIKASSPPVSDPIPDDSDVFTGGVKNVREVAEAVLGGATTSFTVVGQLVYKFGNYNSMNSAILQDVVDGRICALQIYSALGDMRVGDIVKVTGNGQIYGGVAQLSGSVTVEKVAGITAETMAPDTYDTFDAMKKDEDSKISRVVKIRDVTLGEYNGDGSTNVTDKTGATLPIYRAATYPAGMKAGDIVDLVAVLSKYNTTRQFRTGTEAANGFPAYQTDTDTTEPVITMPTEWAKAEKGLDYPISVQIVDNKGVTEASLIYQVNGAEEKTLALVEKSGKYEAAVPGTEITAGGSLKLTIKASDAKGNEATATKTVDILDLPRFVMVSPADRSADVGKRPEISVTLANVTGAVTAKLTLSKTGGSAVLTDEVMIITGPKAVYTVKTDLTDDIYAVKVVVTDGDKIAEKVWQFTVGKAQMKPYFGQLHSHTAEYSDGSGTLAEALDYIENKASKNNVQFVAFTDHSNYFAGTGDTQGKEAEALYDPNSSDKWTEYKNKIADFNETAAAKGILALGGFEMTWSGGPGHINTFNTPGIVSRNNKNLNDKTEDKGLKLYYELLKQDEGKSISQFNHPGETFGTFIDFAYWDKDIDSRMALVEVGNGEGSIGSSGYFPSYEHYTDALDKGWHVAPTNNQDNHKGNWGDANDARTVILTDDFSEQGLYAAMQARRVYATEDKNLEINYKVNGALMGSQIPQSENVNVTFNISDPDTNILGDQIVKVELIANGGRVVNAWDFGDHEVSGSVTLPADYTYYYLRVTQGDRNLAVTAPVWVGKANVVGIGPFKTPTAVPVTGEEMIFTADLFNLEESDATLKSLTFSVNGKVLSSTTGQETLAAGSNVISKTFRFMPDQLGKQTVAVTAVIAANGKTLDYSKKMEIKVMDPNKMVYIGVDAAHFNEYVSAIKNYQKSMGNLTKLAAGYNVRVVELETSEDLIAATKDPKYKVLAFTSPGRRNMGGSGYKTYAQNELDAVAAFAKAGGIVMVAGYADYYEKGNDLPKAGEHMADQQNKLLAAIGSQLRISDDGTLDDTNSAGGPTKTSSNYARLYFSNYNLENPLLNGVIYDGESVFDTRNVHQGYCYGTQVFSQYGGTSIYAVDGDGMPTNVIPAGVNPMVYGYGTTNSVDQDLDGKPNPATPKYPTKEYDPATEKEKDINALLAAASEDLDGGGQVIVSGGAFFSNFEIKPDKDNPIQLSYSNLTIMENLLEVLNPPVITDIKDVQAAPEGKEFTISGLITSNASGHDQATAFFDCIYLQDETGGINAFPVSGNYQVGQMLRISGTTSSYQGERQIAVEQIKVLERTPVAVAPKQVSTQDIAENKVLGQLVKIEGVIVSFADANGKTQTIIVRDSSGYDARVFIDGYITGDKDAALRANLKVGNKITVTGLASYDNTFDGPAPRIRIRDRADVVCKNEAVAIPAGKSYAVITIPPRGFAAGMEGAENDDFMREGVSVADPDPEGAVVVTGTLAYKKGFVGFWPDNTTMQEGNYLALRLTLPGYAGDSMVLSFGDKSLTYENRDGVTPGGNPYFDFIQRLDGKKASFTIKVDLDGSGAAYAPVTYTFGLADLTLEPAPTVGSSDGPSRTVKPDDVKVGEKTVEVKLPSTGAKLNDAASEKLIAANADKPVYLTGGSLNVIIPAGTLSAGADVNAMLVNPKASGSVIKVTKSDGTTAILPIATVSGGQAAYVANIPGKYEVVDNTKTFPDASGHWALPAIGFVSARELFKGDSAGAFNPDQPMTRGMLATVLARIDGGRAASGTPFADVSAGSWYAKEIAWAAQNKLVEGDGKNFNPDSDLTREQLCVILARYLDYSGLTLSETKEMGEFSDLGKVSSWAKDAVEQAVKTGLISGKSGERLDPQGKATRAEIATILQRFVEGVLK